MERPLWQILLVILVLAFVVRSTAVAVTAFLASAEPILLAFPVLQAAAGVAMVVGLWLGRAWVLGALVVLAVSVVASAFVQSVALGVRPIVSAVSEVLAVAVATGALFLALRHEFATGGVERGDGEEDDPRL